MAEIVIVVSNDESRESLAALLRKTGASVDARPFVPDIAEFLAQAAPRAAVIDAAYFEKSDGELKNRLPRTNLIGWMETYNPQRAVDIIALGAMDALANPVTREELTGVVAHFSGTFYYKRKTDFTAGARLSRSLKKPAAFLAGAVVLAAALVFAARFFLTTASPHKPGVWTLNVTNPTGIYVDGKDVWVSDWLSQSIYGFRLKPDGSAQQFESYYLADCAPLFVVKSGKDFWTGSSDGAIRKYSVAGTHPVPSEQFRAPGSAPSGICFAGDFVYSVDSQTGLIYQHVSGAGYSALNSYDYAPGASPVGLVYDGKYFYTADSRLSRVYTHLGPANRFVPVSSYGFTVGDGSEAAGFFKDKKNIYILTAGRPSRLHIYSYKSPK